MTNRDITCDTSGTGSGPSSGSGLGPDFIGSVNEAGHHGISVLEKLREQRDGKRFCDVTVHAGGIDFVAHRAVLVACSPYFESLLDSSGTKRQYITIQTNPGGHTAFDTIIRYMYSGTVTLTDDTVANVFKLSERFVMGHLRERCIDFLQSRLSCHSCFHIRDLADGLGLTGLVRIVDSFIVANISEIIADDSVLELPVAHLEDLLRRTMPLTEIARMRLICRWADYQSNERQKMVFSVLSLHVQWQKVAESSELFHFLHSTDNHSNVPASMPSDWCCYQVLQILKDKCLLPDIYFERLASLQEQFVSHLYNPQHQALSDCAEDNALDSNSFTVEVSAVDDVEDANDSDDIETDQINADILEVQTVKCNRKTSRKSCATAGTSDEVIDLQESISNDEQPIVIEQRQLRKRCIVLDKIPSSKKKKVPTATLR